MPTKKVTSTVNIKPGEATALNVRPGAVTSINYAAKLSSDDNWRYGSFKYGAKKYGTSVFSSAGQKMPKISTTEV